MTNPHPTLNPVIDAAIAKLLAGSRGPQDDCAARALAAVIPHFEAWLEDERERKTKCVNIVFATKFILSGMTSKLIDLAANPGAELRTLNSILTAIDQVCRAYFKENPIHD